MIHYDTFFVSLSLYLSFFLSLSLYFSIYLSLSLSLCFDIPHLFSNEVAIGAEQTAAHECLAKNIQVDQHVTR